MTTWLNKLKIKNEWHNANDKQDSESFQVLCRKIYTELLRIDYLESKRVGLIDQFMDLETDIKLGDCDVHDLNLAMHDLYDWGDYEVDGGKVCWVETF